MVLRFSDKNNDAVERIAGISGCMHRCHLWADRCGHALSEVGSMWANDFSWFMVIWGILWVLTAGICLPCSRCLLGLTLVKDDTSAGVLHGAIFDVTKSAVSYER